MSDSEIISGLTYYYSPPDRLPPGYMDIICRLIESGGSVDSQWVRWNLERAYLIGYVIDKNEIIGCSSLKHPRREYIEMVKEQTGLDLENYLERGYTSVHPDYRGLRIATHLLAGLTKRALEDNRKVYSVIGEENIGGQKIALNNNTRKITVYTSPKSGKKLGIWMPEVMLEG